MVGLTGSPGPLGSAYPSTCKPLEMREAYRGCKGICDLVAWVCFSCQRCQAGLGRQGALAPGSSLQEDAAQKHVHPTKRSLVGLPVDACTAQPASHHCQVNAVHAPHMKSCTGAESQTLHCPAAGAPCAMACSARVCSLLYCQAQLVPVVQLACSTTEGMGIGSGTPGRAAMTPGTAPVVAPPATRKLN